MSLLLSRKCHRRKDELRTIFECRKRKKRNKTKNPEQKNTNCNWIVTTFLCDTMANILCNLLKTNKNEPTTATKWQKINMISCHLHEEWWQEERQREITSRFLCHNFVLNRTEEHFLECHYQKVCRSSSSEYMYGCGTTFKFDPISGRHLLSKHYQYQLETLPTPIPPTLFTLFSVSHILHTETVTPSAIPIDNHRNPVYPGNTIPELSIYLTICSEGPTK